MPTSELTSGTVAALLAAVSPLDLWGQGHNLNLWLHIFYGVLFHCS